MSDYKVKKDRVNMWLPVDIKDWLWQEANKQGFNLTTMIQVIILDYKKQQEAMDMSRVAQLLKEAMNEKEMKENGIM